MKPLIFFRNDDVGELDQSIIRLTELCIRYDMPMSYAAIPTKITPEFVEYFSSLPKQHLFDIHQHGFSHTNYEEAGQRRGEFGKVRPLEDKERDLLAGFAILQEKFGDEAVKIFTPPWNSMDTGTFQLLKKHGYVAFSIKKNPGLNILNTIHDWRKNPYTFWPTGIKNISVSINNTIGCKSDRRAKSISELTADIDRVGIKEHQIGIMLHDKVMDDHAFETLEQLFHLITEKKWTVLRMGDIARTENYANLQNIWLNTQKSHLAS